MGTVSLDRDSMPTVLELSRHWQPRQFRHNEALQIQMALGAREISRCVPIFGDRSSQVSI